MNHYDVIKGLERDDRGYYSAKIWGFLLALRDANEMLLLHPAVTSKVHLVMMQKQTTTKDSITSNNKENHRII